MTFYFYDLETSGFHPRSDRVMQFAGQRTDLDLQPIDKPDNILIRLTPDILPSPDALLVTGILPQKTLDEGLSEVDFLRYFSDKIATPETTIVGFNSVRFDDEFMRFTLWRNFYDAYEWQWKDGRSRWDLLDLVRLTRALRPEGINWPFAPDGSPSCRLELISAVNNLEHVNAHDAMSDVRASLAVARLIRNKQPRLFDYLFNLRDKQKVAALINSAKPFVYTSGRYPSEYEKTTVAVMIGPTEHKQTVLVYDLRIDPTPFLKMSAAQLAVVWLNFDKEAPILPIKRLSFNRCPAVAPLGVLDKASRERLKIDTDTINQNYKKLVDAKNLATTLAEMLKLIQQKTQTTLEVNEQEVDHQLYDGFVPDSDRIKMGVVRAATADELNGLQLDFEDQRLSKLLPLYKARNFPDILRDDENAWWATYRSNRLLSGGENSLASRYFRRIEELSANENLKDENKQLLEELKLYGQLVVTSV